MSREIILAAVLAVMVGIWLGARLRSWRRGAVAIAVGLGLVAAFGGTRQFLRNRSEQLAPKVQADEIQLVKERPIEIASDGYLSSHACRECHPRNHETWLASYHRRMTQVASPETVIGNFDDQRVAYDGSTYHLHRRGDQFWVEMDNPDRGPGIPERIERPIVMTTGSHHMQVYWYPIGHSRVLGQLPIFYLKPEKKWVPRDAAFLRPPDDEHGSETGRWNVKCIFCHSTHGEPNQQSQTTFDTQAAEFGIACEACHGPGEKHALYHRSRADGQAVTGADPMVDPQDLSPALSAQVCGQCHGIHVPYDKRQLQREMRDGLAFRPGQELANARYVVTRNDDSTKHLSQFFGEIEEHFDKQFWADGMIRVSGREYTGLLGSACHTAPQGAMSCLSCHLMHPPESDPRPLGQWADDQLKPGMDGNRACLQCHASTTFETPDHTHHPLGSSGSECQNCHMPHTSYGLLKATRSHHISSPDVSVDVTVGRPNACNLCHLDKTLGWTADHLSQWYGKSPPTLDADQQSIAASVLWTLRGDAGQRALFAWHMGWQPAVEASGSDWLPVWLATLLQDTYNTIRLVAYRSLKSHPGFADFQFDYMDDDSQQAAEKTLQVWQSQQPASSPPRPGLLLGTGGAVDQAARDRLLQQRDNRLIQLAE